MSDHRHSNPKSHLQTLWSYMMHPFYKLPKNSNQLMALLKRCSEHNVLDGQSLRMMEGVLQIATMQIREAMVPRAQMICLTLNQSPKECIQIIKDSKHSRYPVIGENRDDILGILLAKDLLDSTLHHNRSASNTSTIKALCHAPMFTPESKRMDELLRDFQLQHQHMAIVADEYGGVAGLVTIEDIMEQIVGEIEDEFYQEDSTIPIRKDGEHYLIQGSAKISEINQTLSTQFSDAQFDTIGGVLSQKFGYIPKNQEHIEINGIVWCVLHADKRCIRLLSAQPHQTMSHDVPSSDTTS